MMNKIFFLLLIAFLGVSCGQITNQGKSIATGQEALANVNENAKVVIYFFYGKQRCKTCLAVQNITREIIDEKFGTNPDVKFVEIDISDRSNQAVVDKFKVAWGGLILTSKDIQNDITWQAWAMALSNPEGLKELVITETVKMLNNQHIEEEN